MGERQGTRAAAVSRPRTWVRRAPRPPWPSAPPRSAPGPRPPAPQTPWPPRSPCPRPGSDTRVAARCERWLRAPGPRRQRRWPPARSPRRAAPADRGRRRQSRPAPTGRPAAAWRRLQVWQQWQCRLCGQRGPHTVARRPLSLPPLPICRQGPWPPSRSLCPRRRRRRRPRPGWRAPGAGPATLQRAGCLLAPWGRGRGRLPPAAGRARETTRRRATGRATAPPQRLSVRRRVDGLLVRATGLQRARPCALRLSQAQHEPATRCPPGQCSARALRQCRQAAWLGRVALPHAGLSHRRTRPPTGRTAVAAAAARGTRPAPSAERALARGAPSGAQRRAPRTSSPRLGCPGPRHQTEPSTAGEVWVRCHADGSVAASARSAAPLLQRSPPPPRPPRARQTRPRCGALRAACGPRPAPRGAPPSPAGLCSTQTPAHRLRSRTRPRLPLPRTPSRKMCAARRGGRR